MTLDELKAEEDGAVDGEVVSDVEEEVTEGEELDASLEENFIEACETIDKLLGMMEQIVIVPKGRVVKRLPRHFNDLMEEAQEFLEEVDYERVSEEEAA